MFLGFFSAHLGFCMVLCLAECYPRQFYAFFTADSGSMLSLTRFGISGKSLVRLLPAMEFP